MASLEVPFEAAMAKTPHSPVQTSSMLVSAAAGLNETRALARSQKLTNHLAIAQ
jgi:hypothetical protein